VAVERERKNIMVVVKSYHTEMEWRVFFQYYIEREGFTKFYISVRLLRYDWMTEWGSIYAGAWSTVRCTSLFARKGYVLNLVLENRTLFLYEVFV
jgi:hypothetical protein